VALLFHSVYCLIKIKYFVKTRFLRLVIGPSSVKGRARNTQLGPLDAMKIKAQKV
jgi:hypothetical protein